MSELKPCRARNWTEDAPHENGNYEGKCRVCDQSFIGHKRRATCRLCAAMMEGARLAIEAAAGWHDKRYRDTPDAFEMEFHQVSAEAIRNLDLATIIKGTKE